jgi:hypothetical protein
MRAIEFNSQIINNHIELPDGLKNEFQNNSNKPVRVILLMEDFDEGSAFRQLSTEEFLKGYGEEDSVYDSL